MHLLIDADDTLWEDIIYYREVVTSLAQLLANYYSLQQDEMLNQIRKELSQQQHEDIKQHGLGPKSFFISLTKVYEKIIAMVGIKSHQAQLDASYQHIENEFYQRPLLLRDGVEETLSELRKRSYHLYLYTQGNIEYQKIKIARSAIGHYFQHHFILTDKNQENLQTILESHQMPLSSTMVIGNSIRSDINPAKELGLKTIFIKHPYTWERDNLTIVEGKHETHVIENFRDIISVIDHSNETNKEDI